MAAIITVKAFHVADMSPILNRNKEQIEATIECSTDAPAEALGEVTADAMQKAWRTGVDGTAIVLQVSFK